jgi:hypothetical protein
MPVGGSLSTGRLRQHQLVFCVVYAQTHDLATAYQAAYPRAKNPLYAVQNAHRLLRCQAIQTELARQRDLLDRDIRQAAQVTAWEVIENLKRLAISADTDAVRASCWKTLGTHVGLFQERDPLDKVLADVAGSYGQPAADMLRDALVRAGGVPAELAGPQGGAGGTGGAGGAIGGQVPGNVSQSSVAGLPGAITGGCGEEWSVDLGDGGDGGDGGEDDAATDATGDG